MLILCTLLVYGVYNVLCFDYYNHVFMPNEKNHKKIIAYTTLNVLFYYMYILNLEVYPDTLIFLFYIIFYMLEITIVYKASIIKSFLFVSIPAIFHFVIKNILTSVFVIATGQVYANVAKNVNTQLVIIILSLLIPVPLFLLLKKMFMRTVLDSILSNRDVLRFAVAIHGVLYAYLILNVMVYSSYSFEQKLIIHNIKTNILILFIFSMSMLYTFIFARLQMYVYDYNQINKLVEEEEQKLSDLSQEATTDMLTGFKTRDVAEKAIKSYLEENVPFYVVFIDLDGLKSTNDGYGHEEGDFYIKHVAEIITRSFMGNITARIGGDEFLIVGNIMDEFNLRNSITICHDKVLQISSVYKKPYSTSISYGAVFVEQNTKMSMDDIVSLADSRMYEFKSKKKRLRTVTNPGSKRFVVV